MARTIHVQGIVQGVGFRPYVYRLAQELKLNGWVHNASDGVHILVGGSEEDLESFVRELEVQKPPAAVITNLTWEETPEEPGIGFSIQSSSVAEGERTFVSPDLATCPDCLKELLDPSDRRYHYPFINCTNCGPRFTIIKSLPYDRPTTAMADFVLCEVCEEEYLDPSNRRFHAQPNACFECGPHLALYVLEDHTVLVGDSQKTSDVLINQTARLLHEGKIIAVKGLGGYHLTCDASNETAVRELRKRKQRPRKPLAIMLASLEAVEQRFSINTGEAELLTSVQAPIVLLQNNKHRTCRMDTHAENTAWDIQADTHTNAPQTTMSDPDSETQVDSRLTPLAPSVTCGVSETGVMLPSTPLQHLLLKATGIPLVMTSGNISEEPIIADDTRARELLGSVADAFLSNDRPIISRYDDSVLRVLTLPERNSAQEERSHNSTLYPFSFDTQVVRRARGYAPSSLALEAKVLEGETILAVGPEQKNTFSLAVDNEVIVSQHLGDLTNAEAFNNQLESIDLYEDLFSLKPTVLACDAHPEYLSTKWAHEQARTHALPLIEVQHHHAHIAAVLAEHLPEGQLSEEEVIGIALDGTGYGTDGTLWGGEVLIASLTGFERFASLEPFRLPGGAQAIKHPLRGAYSLLLQHDLTEHPAAQRLKETLGKDAVTLIEQMVAKGLNSPLTSSAGRLFDAVSALLGVCKEASYEGEPAILLEACMSAHNAESSQGSLPTSVHSAEAMSLAVTKMESSSLQTRQHSTSALTAPAQLTHTPDPENTLRISVHALLTTILEQQNEGVAVGEIARFFHDTLMHHFKEAVLEARRKTGIMTVALSGGVFNNRYLASNFPRLLETEGFTVLTHSKLPPNDGCISCGQAVVASACLNKSEEAGTLRLCV